MASKTIIIESNRNVAYSNARQETRTTQYIGSQEEEISNNRWTTYIPDGLQINIGDQINLEASMINSIGGGDEVMEFTGNSNNKYGSLSLSDRSSKLRLNYYISNLFQFNFNYPKSGCKLEYNTNSPSYGGPAFQTNKLNATTIEDFDVFESNYPYECLEGFSTDLSAVPRIYTPADPTLKPSYMKPPPELFNPSDNRLFIGNSNYRGPYYFGNNNNPENFMWIPLISDVDLQIATGFNTPSSIAENLTSQLHARDGNANSWDILEVESLQFNIEDDGRITSKSNPGITDSTYKTFPTSTGKPFYARLNNNWNCAFDGEKLNGNPVDKGTGYIPRQGSDLFYSYIMTNQPAYYRGMTSAYILLQQKPAGTASNLLYPNYEKFTIHSGPNENLNERYIVNTDYGVGLLGNNTCLIDNLPSVNGTVTYFDTLQKTLITAIMPTLNLQEGNGITTNIIYNNNTITAIKNYISNAFEIDSSSIQDRNNKSFLESHIIPFYFGRIDDQMSDGSSKAIIQLTPPNFHNTPPPATPNYYNQEYINPDGSTFLDKAMCGNIEWKEHKHSCYSLLFDKTKYNVVNAMSNSIPGLTNLYPHNPNSLFMTAHPTGDYSKLKEIYDNLYNEKIAGLGLIPLIIPVYYKDLNSAIDGKLGQNAYGVPFMCFIYKNGPSNLPLPGISEFCLFDTSLSACQMSQIATTQKINNSGLYPQPDITQPENTRPEKYMPYCYAGASDSLINFDSGYSKFTLSQFHTPIKTGNGQYQNSTEPVNTNPEQNIMNVVMSEAHMTTIDSNGQPIPYIAQSSQGSKQPVLSTQSGICIEDLFVFFNEDKPLSNQSNLKIEYFNQNYFTGTLFEKLGFDYEQLIPFYGQAQCEFNRGNYNKYIGKDNSINVFDKYKNMVKPFTTNSYISSAEAISLAQQLAIIRTSNNDIIDIVVPSAKIGGIINKQATTNASSDLLIAKNMPRKLSYPYLVVYTDIIRNAIYYGGPSGYEKLNAIAYITRNYAEGDYFYSFTTNWSYTADTDYVITSIMTDIRLPDGSPAPINDNSSVIYKITKPQIMPIPPTLKLPEIEKKIEQDKDA